VKVLGLASSLNQKSLRKGRRSMTLPQPVCETRTNRCRPEIAFAPEQGTKNAPASCKLKGAG